jgi:hypothetical protein
MRSGPHSSGTLSVRLSRTLPRVGTLLVILAAVGLLAVSPIRASSWSASLSYAWGNGAVNCVFNASTPAVIVSATHLTGTGMGLGLEQVDERTPGGTTVATAVTSSVPWDPVNDSTSVWFDMNYSGTVPVTNATVPSHQDGVVQLNLDFGLTRNLSVPTHADQVFFTLSLSGWPWQGSQDNLALVVPVWSAFATSEHVVVGSSSSPTVESLSTASGQPLEYFTAGTSANGTTGAPIPVSAETTLTAGKATTTLTLGPGVSGASALTYQATLGIIPSTHVLGLPLYDYAAVAGGAGLVALVVGVSTGRIRRRPSDLTYVEESE